MKMLKRFIFILTVAVCAASCLKDGYMNSYRYHLGATFEGMGVSTSDSVYFEKQIGMGIAWRDMAFYHKLNEEKTEFQGGFILSNLKSGGKDVSKDRYRVNSGKSSTYMVYYCNLNSLKMPEHDIQFLMSQYGSCLMNSCMVNNTKEVVEAVRKTFVAGDSLAVKMTGYKGGQKTGERKYLLAKKTENKDSLVTNWSYFDLKKLGDVEYIDIELISTKGDNIIKAFCLDDMDASISIAY